MSRFSLAPSRGHPDIPAEHTCLATLMAMHDQQFCHMSARWEKTRIMTDSGMSTEALAPAVISASRATDIPGLYADWFFHRFSRGHLAWINPFNRRVRYVSFERTRCIVFWSKNPSSLLRYLPVLEKGGTGCAVQFTLNDYGPEGFEPGIPPLNERIAVFSRLSELLGPDRVVWRFDPVLIAPGLCTDEILERISTIGDQVHPFTKRLVISFIDLNRYPWLAARLGRRGIREPARKECIQVLEGLIRLNRRWGLRLSTCAEPRDMTQEGIDTGGCIDPELVSRASLKDTSRQDLIRFHRKDPGQRKECCCMMSRDIGRYGSCTHGCVYCYATRSQAGAVRVYERFLRDPHSECLGGLPEGTDEGSDDQLPFPGPETARPGV